MDSHGAAPGRLGRIRGALREALRRVEEDRLGLWAASLTVRTLLSLVPLLAVATAALPVFVKEKSLRDAIVRKIVATFAIAKAEPVEQAVRSFLENVNFEAAGVVGFVLLVLSAFSLITGTERALNAVFRIRSGRPVWRRFASFWTVVTLGFVCLGGSITFTGMVERILPAGAPLVTTWILPILVSVAGFTIAYAVIPHGGFPLGAALRGGVLAALLFEGLKRGYATYLLNVVPYERVYGSLAALPLFILGVHLSWLVFLYGAEFARIRLADEGRRVSLDPAEREALGVEAIRRVAAAFLEGRGPVPLRSLAREMRLTDEALRGMLDPLHARGLLLLGADGTCQMGRDPGRVIVRDVITALRGSGPSPRDVPERLQALWSRFEAGGASACADTTIRDLAEPPSDGTSLPAAFPPPAAPASGPAFAAGSAEAPILPPWVANLRSEKAEAEKGA